jgi:hypothetical protein
MYVSDTVGVSDRVAPECYPYTEPPKTLRIPRGKRLAIKEILFF